MSRAIVFDLDDTLYPERRFALSGFVAVAREAEREFAVPAAEAFGVLRRALAVGRRSTAFQELAARFGLPDETVRLFRSHFRGHDPRLRLPRGSAETLKRLRPDWKLGILTNGYPDIQARKIAALDLADRVDVIVYALNTGAGKPESGAFEAVLNRLGAEPAGSVFVGDDPRCDIAGARRVGMKTIRIRRGAHAGAPVDPDNEADAVADSVAAVPTIAATLVAQEERHVA